MAAEDLARVPNEKRAWVELVAWAIAAGVPLGVAFLGFVSGNEILGWGLLSTASLFNLVGIARVSGNHLNIKMQRLTNG